MDKDLRNSIRIRANWSLLSKYRTELFGIGSLGVLIVHALPYLSLPSPFNILTKVMGLGQIGVHIFLILSGIGLYFSLNKNNNLVRYYKNRIGRVLIPYLVISCIYYFWSDIWINFQPKMFVYDISMISFWLYHKGAWYIAFMIPVYLIFPLLFKWMKNSKKRLIPILLCVTVSILVSSFIYSVNIQLFNHLLIIFLAVPTFLAGCYFGKYVMEEKNISISIFLLCGFSIIVKRILPINRNIANNLIYPYGITIGLGIAACVIFPIILDYIKSSLINRFLRFLGKMSLEIYLTNIYLQGVFNYFNFSYTISGINFNPYGILNYSLIVITGIIISALFHKLFSISIKQTIVKKLNNSIAQ